MKIYNEQISALTQGAAKTRQTWGKSDEAFGDLLAREMGKAGDSPPSSQSVPMVPQAQYLLGLDATQAGSSTAALDGESSSEQVVMDKIDSILSGWENYAAQLDPSAGGSLKSAYDMLENLSGEVSEIRQNYHGSGSGLGSIINELEIMTATEKIKFNRGDYS